MLQSSYKHWNYIFCEHEPFEFLLYKPWLIWFLWIWAFWFICIVSGRIFPLGNSVFSEWIGKPPVTLGGYAAFLVLNRWCHQVFPLGSCPWLPTFCFPAGFGELWPCFYSSLGKWDLWYTVGVPVHICDLHLGRAKDAGHIVLDMNVWPVKEG